MSAEFPSLDRLESQVRALAAAEKPSEVFRLLLESARLSGPRAAVFLLRQGRIKGWGSLGYDAATSQRQRTFSIPAGAGWLGGIAAREDSTLHLREASGVDPDFGQSAADEAAAIAVRVKGKPIAFLLTERTSGEEPWFPSCLGVLVQVAELRLDLDLARRKLQSTRAGGPSGRENRQPLSWTACPARITSNVQTGFTKSLPEVLEVGLALVLSFSSPVRLPLRSAIWEDSEILLCRVQIFLKSRPRFVQTAGLREARRQPSAGRDDPRIYLSQHRNRLVIAP